MPPEFAPVTDRVFFAGSAQRLARRLLGCVLVRRLGNVVLAGIIVETEAYLGARDAASHAFRNRRTARTEPMFGPPGTAYVYFTYGMHHCLNVVCGRVGVPAAVLLRALRPIAGLDQMRARRPSAAAKPDTALCSGPARLCQAMDVDRRLNAIDLTVSEDLWIARPPDGRSPKSSQIAAGPRIGVDYAGDWASKPLRFWITDDANVSGAPASRRGTRL
jgi:DNA-3-methyladenine glycosylase